MAKKKKKRKVTRLVPDEGMVIAPPGVDPESPMGRALIQGAKIRATSSGLKLPVQLTFEDTEKPRHEKIADKNQDGFWHTEDYRTVGRSRDEQIELTATQARVINILHELHKRTPGATMGLDSIRQKMGFTVEDPLDCFKDYPAVRKKLIATGSRRGAYRLNI